MSSGNYNSRSVRRNDFRIYLCFIGGCGNRTEVRKYSDGRRGEHKLGEAWESQSVQEFLKQTLAASLQALHVDSHQE